MITITRNLPGAVYNIIPPFKLLSKSRSSGTAAIKIVATVGRVFAKVCNDRRVTLKNTYNKKKGTFIPPSFGQIYR